MAKKSTPPQKQRPTEADIARARTSRTVAFVLVGAMGLCLLAQAIAPMFGLPGEYAILFDLAALAAFFWAMFVAWGLWRKRNE